MTIKQFLKSKTFKSIIVLLAIALVCGGLLAILNDVLYISDEEKTQNAIKKIYGSEMAYEEVILKEEETSNQYGEIEAVYAFVDGNYLIKATGGDGYKNGTVTAWVVASFTDGEFRGLKAVTLGDYEKQTLMSNFGDSFLSVFSSEESDQKVLEGKYFSATVKSDTITNISSGATMSSKAFDNAVNASLYYIRNASLAGREIK